ncbi:uncharacterized protein LOC144656038 [Oculina patagonica]
MGNNCSTCGVSIDSGNYCSRCYERRFPSCSHCKKPLLSNQQIVGNYHKFPCYEQRFPSCSHCKKPLLSNQQIVGNYHKFPCYEQRFPSCSHCKKPLLPNQQIVGNYHKFPCYEQTFPSCIHCKQPLLPNQKLAGNYHKFPCYSKSTGKCFKCDAPVDLSLKGNYCKNCYDSKNPPPQRLRIKQGDKEVIINSRDDELQRLAYAFGRGLSDGGQQRYFLTDH